MTLPKKSGYKPPKRREIHLSPEKVHSATLRATFALEGTKKGTVDDLRTRLKETCRVAFEKVPVELEEGFEALQEKNLTYDKIILEKSSCLGEVEKKELLDKLGEQCKSAEEQFHHFANMKRSLLGGIDLLPPELIENAILAGRRKFLYPLVQIKRECCAKLTQLTNCRITRSTASGSVPAQVTTSFDAIEFSRKPREKIGKAAKIVLESWFNEHRANPYPTEVQKLELLSRTGISMAKLVNWLTNTRARRWKTWKAKSAPNTLPFPKAPANALKEFATEPPPPKPPSPEECSIDVAPDLKCLMPDCEDLPLVVDPIFKQGVLQDIAFSGGMDVATPNGLFGIPECDGEFGDDPFYEPPEYDNPLFVAPPLPDGYERENLQNDDEFRRMVSQFFPEDGMDLPEIL